MDGNALLDVAGITAGYGKYDVLKDVSLVVFPGEIVSIIGPNGAGKSTVFRTIFGKVRPRDGRVRFSGEDITGVSPAEVCAKRIALAPQGRCVFPHMTVWENLELGAFIRRDTAGIHADMKRLGERFPVLEEKRRTLAGALSGGEQQMLELARCLMLRPRLMLVDEPSLGLAPKVVTMVFDILKGLRDEGLTILMVEQNAKRALQVSDRGYVLELGRNRFEGTGRELLENPDVRRLYLGGG